MIPAILMNQVEKVKEQIKLLPSNLTPTQRRKKINAYTYTERETNKNFCYWAVLNSGKAGETLASQPTKSQKELYKIILEDIPSYCGYCDFKENETILSITEYNKNIHPMFKRVYEEIIPYNF